MAVHYRKARKQHQCDYCDRQIEVDEIYHHQSARGFTMGAVMYSNVRAHLACAGLISQAMDEVAEHSRQMALRGDRNPYVLDLDGFWETGNARKAMVRLG